MGDQIRQADGSTGTVWLKWEVHKTKEMYNLTVDTAHTFYVGEGQWLVHNACGKPKTSVFWSGGDEAKSAAVAWARDNYGKTLELTPGGKTVEKITRGMPWDEAVKYWEVASEKFAGLARGDVHVFLTSSAAKRTTSIWARIELPRLMRNSKVKNIIKHIID